MNLFKLHQNLLPTSLKTFLTVFMLSIIGSSIFAQGNCGVTYTTAPNSITVSDIVAPHYFMKLLNPNWTVNFECVDNCSDPQTVSNLPAGTYHLAVSKFDANWQLDCDFIEDVVISGGTGGGITINCPADLTINAAPGNLVTFDWPDVTGTTDCATGGLTITQTQGPTPGTQLLANNSDYTISYEATDACGNSTSCTFIVTETSFFADVEFTFCPEDVTVNATSPDGAIVTFQYPELSTNCPDGATIFQTASNLTSGEVFPIGTTEIVYQGIVNSVGGCGGAGTTCTLNVTVRDGGPIDPITINCPADLTINAAPGNLVTFDWPEVTGSTTCATGGLTITQTQGPTPGTQLLANNSDYTISYEATDDCGNSTSCTFILTEKSFFADIEFTFCPEDVTVNATSPDGAVVTFQYPELSTNCPDGATIFQVASGLTSGEVFPIGTTEIVYQGVVNNTGGCGGAGTTCSLFITVTDDTSGACNVSIGNIDGGLTVSGLTAPHVIFKLFNPDWSINDQCFDNCTSSLTYSNLTEGATYHVSYQLYDASWQPICNEIVDVVITGIGGPVDILPDLTLANLNAPASGATGTLVDFQVDHQNIGTTGFTADYFMGFYLSSDNTLSADDLFLAEDDLFSSTVGSITIPHSFILPGSVAIGNYYLILKTDSYDDITELNENNNTISTPFTVTDGTTGAGPCNIEYSIADGEMTITGAGLNAPHVIVQLFRPDWSTAFSCLDNCGGSIVVPDVTSGTYHLSVNLYDANWNPTCDFLEDIPVGAVNRRANTELSQFKEVLVDNLYPVPASSSITMELSSLEEVRITAQIYDARGSLKGQKHVDLFSGINTIQWDISELPSGVYQIVLDTKGIHSPIRFIKERL